MDNIVEQKRSNTMTQKQIVNAYLVLARMSSEQLPFKVAYGLFQLRKQQEPTFNFRMEQERLVVDRYHGVPKDGIVSFSDQDDAKKAYTELEELNNMEIQIDISPVSISADDIAQAKLSMNDIETLDGFVIWK